MASPMEQKHDHRVGYFQCQSKIWHINYGKGARVSKWYLFHDSIYEIVDLLLYIYIDRPENELY